MPIEAAARRAVAVWRELGPGPSLLYALDKLLKATSGGRAAAFAYGIYAQPLHAPGLAAVREGPETLVLQVGPQSPLTDAFPRPRPVNERRFAAGATCYAASVRGRFAGHVWIRREHYDEDEVRCLYVMADPQREVWDFDVYVEPEFRLGRTLARLWKAVAQDLARGGVHWSMSRISLFNRHSIATHLRLGARRLGSVVFVRLGRVQFGLFSLRPYVHLSWSASNRPTLRLPSVPSTRHEAPQA
jgi:hypothetical protein